MLFISPCSPMRTRPNNRYRLRVIYRRKTKDLIGNQSLDTFTDNVNDNDKGNISPVNNVGQVNCTSLQLVFALFVDDTTVAAAAAAAATPPSPDIAVLITVFKEQKSSKNCNNYMVSFTHLLLQN
ncbi:hypothetical protein JOB18_003541 [Solea senegalensis]|uniref:Uncharacterized protein n=1 Tax=Solea senegalensis TaxID=28829 RepID=A0AAV6RBF6_SOLSE|nr:hypothetical protein JOB18_003541 [Solea senegalensis]